MPSSHSGIHFDNAVQENDSVNPLDLEYLYNGGGIAAGDFNRDGLPDLYFTASLTANRLYLNQGGFRFRDITREAAVTGDGHWCNGATVVDINNDGWPDIYVCSGIYSDTARRRNLLYVNQGLDSKGVPVFREMAREYGLADTSYSVQAAFFDYDNDGDLDMYLVTTAPARRDVAQFSANGAHGDGRSVDRLFRNSWDSALGHPVFTDVSMSAGITEEGYGLGIAIADLNGDGWKDIYVTNDFLTSDQLYINNRDGTFTNKVAAFFKHTSQNAMGNDIADLDNDGLADILTVDMNPPDNLRKKTNLGGSNYILYRYMLDAGYMLQYVRNTLQWNRGPRVLANDSLGDPVFSEIAFYAGVAETDWSWNAALADMDNDGYRDILITNGYPRDVTDHDFTAFRQRASAGVAKKDIIDQIPRVPLHGYAFHNLGHMEFSDMTKSWGLQTTGFANGAVCVDLDNDGDLDYVVNRINGEALVFENTLSASPAGAPGYLELSFAGPPQNRDGIGVRVDIYYGHGQHQTAENAPVRGYLSCVAPTLHFGLGNCHRLDSISVSWREGQTQTLHQVTADRSLRVDFREADSAASRPPAAVTASPLFSDVTAALGIHYQHRERDFIDFSVETLLPHKFSQYGPALAAADLDGNGLDDLVLGASAGDRQRHLLLQQTNGRFVTRDIALPVVPNLTFPENRGIVSFDADGDGHTDIYFTSGGNEAPAGSPDYQDQLWINDGTGEFHLAREALPDNHTSKSCVKAADFDGDGDLDLFVGGRVLPGAYPRPVNSFIFRNDSKPGYPKFTDVTKEIAPGLDSIGLICDAIWTDYDNDGHIDLVVIGEWMPVKFFHNEKGRLVDRTAGTGLTGAEGWWNSIAAGDFDNDGDIDYVIGNLGQNSFFRASPQRPLHIYGADLDGNGTYESILTLFLPDASGACREFPAASRDELMRQLPALKKRFLTYSAYGKATIDDVLTPDVIHGALQSQASEMRSVYLENLGGGRFRMHPLPMEAQLAPVYGMVVDDLDGDGNLDLALSGNDFGNEPSNGRYDAFNGLVLLGDGKGGFHATSIAQNGLYIPGDGKALAALPGPHGELLVAASQNNGPLKLFRLSRPGITIRIPPDVRLLFARLKNGPIRRQEIYAGSSFISQSAKYTRVSPAVVSIETIDSRGNRRRLWPH